MRQKFFSYPFLWLFFIGLAVSKANAEVRFFNMPSKDKPISISIRTEYFTSSANYSDSEYGQRAFQWSSLEKDGFFTYTGFYPEIRYSPVAVQSSVFIFAESFFAKSKSHTLNFRPTLVGGGMDFFFEWKRNLYAGAEIRAGAPLYAYLYNPQFSYEEEVVVGNRVFFVEPGLWFAFQHEKIFFIHLNTAFRFRESLSSLWFNQLGAYFQIKRDLRLGGSVDSFFSVLGDEFSNQPEKRHSLLNKTSSGSRKFQSVNPWALSFTGYISGSFFQPLWLKLYLNMDTIGSNYAKGLTAGVQLTFKWSTAKGNLRIEGTDKPLKFDFKGDKEEAEALHDEEEGEEAYLQEETDPYSNKQPVSNELKEELDSLKD